MPLAWDNISALTTRKFIPVLQDAVYKSNPLFILLDSKSRIILDGGRTIVEPVQYATPPGGAYERFDTLDVSPKEIVTSMELKWKLYYVAATVSEHDLLLNYGTSRVMDFLAVQMRNLDMGLRDLLGTALFKLSPSAKEIDSLPVAIHDSGTYAGLDRTSDAPWFRGNVVNHGNAEPSFLAFQDLYGACTQGDTSPDLIVTTQKIFNKLWAMALPSQRHEEGDEVTLGWPYIRFNRARVMVDSHVPAGYAFFLNTDYMKLFVHVLRDFVFSGWLTGPTQDSRTGRIHWAGNLVVQNPRFFGKMFNISEA